MEIIDDPRVCTGIMEVLFSAAWATANLHPLFQKTVMPASLIHRAIRFRNQEWRPGGTTAENVLLRSTIRVIKFYFLNRALQCWSARATMTFGQKMRIFGSAGFVAGLDWLHSTGMTHYQMKQEERSAIPFDYGLGQLFTSAVVATASLHPVFFTRVLPIQILAVAWYRRDSGESTEKQLMNAAVAAALFCLPALAIRHALCKWPMRDAMNCSQQMLVFGGATIVALAPPAWNIYKVQK